MVTPVRRWFPLVALGLLACQPEFTDRPSEIAGPRILAVRVDPPEVPKDTTVKFTPLVVGPDGTDLTPRIDWAFCTAPKPLAETNDVGGACTEFSGQQFVNLGVGQTASGSVPDNACRQFGPDVPEGTTGRPADPDPTGGYYQPVRLAIAEDPNPAVAIGQVRLTCGLPNSSQGVLQTFAARSKPNTNPELSDVKIVGGASLSLEGAADPTRVQHGATVTLRASWPACPLSAKCGDGFCTIGESSADCPNDCTDPKGCAGAEQFVYYDPLNLTLADRRESMRVAWYSTAGSFAHDHTGRTGDETESFTDNEWHAPDAPGVVHLWAVLRDDRGGIGWQRYVIDVQ